MKVITFVITNKMHIISFTYLASNQITDSSKKLVLFSSLLLWLLVSLFETGKGSHISLEDTFICQDVEETSMSM